MMATVFDSPTIVLTVWGLGLIGLAALGVAIVVRSSRSACDHRMVAVADLREGDLVDLAGDQFSDPSGDDPYFECEYLRVGSVTYESDDCIVVYYDEHACGYPPDHKVKVAL